MTHKDARTLWTTALRSGKYKQGKGALRKPDETYCCLGVACDVYNKETGEGEWIVMPTNTPDEMYGFYNRTGSLPNTVLEWFGKNILDQAEGELVYMNDSKENPKNFLEIADYIDSLPEEIDDE